MYHSQEYLKRAENCAVLAELSNSAPVKRRYERIEAAWRALAAEQRWLDAEVAPQETHFIPSTPDDATVEPAGQPR
jgi:hypothetical protein